MKKLLFIIVLFLLNISTPVLATSGACSSHNGVNCGSGPDWDNSVICNDGWSESSVSYISADECQDNISCTASQYQNLISKYNVEGTKNEILDISNQISNIILQANKDIENVPIACDGECPSRAIYATQQQIIDQANAQINPLKSQIDGLKLKLRYDIDSLTGECKAMGYDRINQLYLQALINHNLSIKQEPVVTPITPAIQQEIKLAENQEPKKDTPVENPSIKKIIKKAASVKITISTPTTTPAIIQTTTIINTPVPLIVKEPVKKSVVSRIYSFFSNLLNIWKKK